MHKGSSETASYMTCFEDYLISSVVSYGNTVHNDDKISAILEIVEPSVHINLGPVLARPLPFPKEVKGKAQETREKYERRYLSLNRLERNAKTVGSFAK